MIAQRQRILRSGTQYDALLPASTGQLIEQRLWEGAHDSVSGVKRFAREYRPQTAKLAQVLRGADLRTTAKNIWEFIYHHIQYKNDQAGFEQIRSPARSWAERKTGVDCDDYSIITSSILLNLGIPHKLRMTAYSEAKGWQHIYVVIPKSGKLSAPLDQSRRNEYIVIDAVTDAFDYEVHYAKREDFPMDIQFLNGLDGTADADGQHAPHPSGTPARPTQPGGELGKTFFGKLIQKVGNTAKKVGKAVLTVTTTPVRLGILAWMKLNVKQAGAKLRWAYQPYNQATANAGYGPQAYAQIVKSAQSLRNTFVKLGGNEGSLRMAILTGHGNKDRAVPSSSPALAGLAHVLLTHDADWQALQHINSIHDPWPNVAGLEGLQGQGLGIDPATDTVIAVATAVVVPILNMLSKAKANDPNDPVPDEYAPDDDGSDGNDASASAADETAPAADDSAPADAPATGDGDSDSTGTSGLGQLGALREQARRKATARKAGASGTVQSPVAHRVAGKRPVSSKPHSPGHPVRVATKPLPAIPLHLPLVTTGPVQTTRSTIPLPDSLPNESAVRTAIAKTVTHPKKPGLLTKTGAAVTSVVQAVVGTKASRKAKKAHAKAHLARKTTAVITADPVDPVVVAADGSAITNGARKVADVLTTAARATDQVRQGVRRAKAAVQAKAVQPTASDNDPASADPNTDPTADPTVDPTATSQDTPDTSAESTAPAADPAAQPGFFETADGKPDYLKIGGAALGALVVGKVLLGGLTSPGRPARSGKGKSSGLSGTSGSRTPGKKSNRKKSKRSTKPGLGDLSAVALT